MARRLARCAVLVRILFQLSTINGVNCIDFGINTICPENCVCKSLGHSLDVDCARQNLTAIPREFSPNTSHLDLSLNEIHNVQEFAFISIPHLEELRLFRNHLKSLPANCFAGLHRLKTLYLSGNQFTRVPMEALQTLTNLEHLHLDTNQISHVPDESFAKMYQLRHLWLNGNSIQFVPITALSNVPSLEVLYLSVNQIKTVPDNAFYNNSRLSVLLLHNNEISEIGDHAFEGLGSLELLEINWNHLTRVPVSLSALPALEDLTLADNQLEYLPEESFKGNPKLVYLQLKGNPISSVAPKTFANLPNLEKLILSEARDQDVFPDLSGSVNIKILGFDRASIEAIPSDICSSLPKLQSLDIHSNRILDIPDLNECSELRILNLGHNKLTSLEGEPFLGLSQLRDLILAHNYITEIPRQAFTGLTRLQYLDMLHNRIGMIHPQAFHSLDQLEDLNLGENSFPDLPTDGLANLKHLKTYHNKELQDFPLPDAFPKIRYLTLSYAYHCCEFIENAEETTDGEIELSEDIHWLRNEEYDSTLLHNLTNIHPSFDNLNLSEEDLGQVLYEGFGTDYTDYEIPTVPEDYFKEYKPQYYAEDIILAKPPIQCKPMPGPFMPCVDLFGCWLLRCGVWLVFLLAVLGNGVVLFVSVSSRSKMDVPKFLICNLACADFCMGIYLGFLAIVDASTLGEFKKHAIKWQTSPGCLIAGFLGVLSSELSVFTLTVITLERFYAITHAMQLNKRLSLNRAGYIMLGGWMFAILVASLPLFGISDYRKFAVCLPFETSNTASLGYVCFIMLFNGISFSVIVGCYMKMYCSIRGSHAWNSNDTRVAKRMALLVFTDFACWAPITFFSLTAAFGIELISLDEAKIFTVFVLPLNSCANPFLYAILTKQFKKDCVKLCKRLEETAVSRRLTRISNRNGSSWSSSRRPSGANSFFNVEKRESITVNGGLVNYNVDLNNSGPSRTGTTWASSSGAWSSRSKGGNRTPASGCGSKDEHVSSLRQCNVCMHVIKESHTTPAEEEMLEELHQNVLKIEKKRPSESEPDEQTSFDADIRSHGKLNNQGPPEADSMTSTSSKSAAACEDYHDGDANDSLDSDKGIPLLPFDSTKDVCVGEVQGAVGGSEDTPATSASYQSNQKTTEENVPVEGSADLFTEKCLCREDKAKKHDAIDSHVCRKSAEGHSPQHLSRGQSANTMLFKQCPCCQKSSLCITGSSVQDVLTCNHSMLPYSKDLSIILEKQGLGQAKFSGCDNFELAKKKLLGKKHFDLSQKSRLQCPCHSRIPSQSKRKSSKQSNRSNSWADLSEKHHRHSSARKPKRHSVTTDYLYWIDDLEFRDSAFVEDETCDQDSEISLQSSPGHDKMSPSHDDKNSITHHDKYSVSRHDKQLNDQHFVSCHDAHIKRQWLKSGILFAPRTETDNDSENTGRSVCSESKPLLEAQVDSGRPGLTLSRSFDRESGFSSDC